MFEISAFDRLTMSMCRCMQVCVDEFLTLITEGVVHGVCKVVTRLSFCVIRRHKMGGSEWMLHHCVTRSHMNPGQ